MRLEEPHHVLRDAPVGSRWWMQAALLRIDEARPDEIEGIAKEIVPFAWGAIRKIRGGLGAKKSWLRWSLVLQRCIAIRATEDVWREEKSYGIEEEDPIEIYRPIVEAVIEEIQSEDEAEISKALRERVGGEDWKDEKRSQSLVSAILNRQKSK